MRPKDTDYAAPFADYIANVPEDDVLDAIERQSSETQKFLATLDDSRAAFRYEASKWSVKEVIGHLIDAERVMSFRALAFARGDTQPLPGFEEKDYVQNAHFDDWSLGDLAESYALVRRANIVFFCNLPAEAWDRRGVANDNAITVRALAYVIVGHERHHLRVLKERYRL